MILFFLTIGLFLLVVGAEALVRGASWIATAAGISPLVIGLTVVAYGTSTPEMVVSVVSNLAGQTDIALGNVVGSNIFNILFILGMSALIVPLKVSQQLVRLDVPLMIIVSILTLIVGGDGKISRLDGVLLFSGAIAYTVFLIRISRKKNQVPQDKYALKYGDKQAISLKSWMRNILLIVGGLGLLILGARWLVESAVSIARLFGISELVIGLTIVAAGTSLPEAATSIVASLRGERDIAVGNVIGSNIFNLLAVLGLSSIVVSDGIDVSMAARHFDIPVMIAVSVACLPIFFSGSVIARWEGALFLAYYAAYTLYLVLAATQHAALPMFSMAMIWFIIPLTGVTLIVVTLLTRSKAENAD